MSHRLLKARISTEENRPVLKALIVDTDGEPPGFLYERVEPIPGLDLGTTPPLPHHVLWREAARIPEGVRWGVLPVSAKRSVGHVFIDDPRFPKETLPPLFRLADGRFAPRTRWSRDDLAALFADKGFAVARDLSRIDPDRPSVLVRERLVDGERLQRAELMPITPKRLETFARHDVFWNDLFPLWRFDSWAFEDEGLAREVLRNEVRRRFPVAEHPLDRPPARDHRLFAKVVGVPLGAALSRRQGFRVSVYGFQDAIFDLYWELRSQPERSPLFGERDPKPPYPFAQRVRRDPLGIHRRQLYAEMGFPALMAVDPERSLRSQSLMGLSRAELLHHERAGFEATIAELSRPGVLDRLKGYVDLELRGYDTRPRGEAVGRLGEIVMAALGNGRERYVLSALWSGRSHAAGCVLVPVRDEYALVDRVFRAPIPLLDIHNEEFDVKKLREADEALTGDEFFSYVHRRDQRRLEEGRPRIDPDQVAALERQERRKAAERAARAVPKSRRRRFRGLVGCTQKMVQHRGGQALCNRKLEVVDPDADKGGMSYERLERLLWSSDPRDRAEAEDYTGGDRAVREVGLRGWPAVLAHMRTTGRPYPKAMGSWPAEGYAAFRSAEFFRDYGFLRESVYRSFADLEAARDRERPVLEWLARMRPASSRPRFLREAYLGVPLSAFSIFSSLFSQYPYLNHLYGSLPGFSEPLTRLTAAHELLAFLQRPVSEACSLVESAAKRLGTRLFPSEIYGDPSQKGSEGARLVREERALNLYLHWVRPETELQPDYPHARLHYHNALADGVAWTPQPLVTSTEGWVSLSDKDLYPYEREPLYGVVFGKRAILRGRMQWAVGCAPHHHDPLWDLLERARDEGATRSVLDEARSLERDAGHGQVTVRRGVRAALEAWQASG